MAGPARFSQFESHADGQPSLTSTLAQSVFMDAPVASLKLVEVAASGMRTPIQIEVGRPYLDNRGSWACVIRIEGLDGKPRDIYGEDSLQALCSGLRLVHSQLKGVLERGGRLIHSGDGSDFPLDAYFEDLSNGDARSSG